MQRLTAAFLHLWMDIIFVLKNKVYQCTAARKSGSEIGYWDRHYNAFVNFAPHDAHFTSPVVTICYNEIFSR